MKKQAHLCLVACLAVSVVATESRAGSIDYLTNQSADFIRTLGRNAATDAVDIVSHNPAGTTFLFHDGLYLSLSGQTVLKAFSITYRDKVYEANNPTPFLPSFHAAFKFRNLAIFAAFTVPAGGGDLTYEDGVPYLIPLVTQVKDKNGNKPMKGHFEGSSMYLAGTFGAAYKLFNMVSISAAMRVISAKKAYLGWAYYESDDKLALLDATKTAAGVGGIFGIHVRPFKYLDIGIRFETETKLPFETESETTNLHLNPLPQVKNKDTGKLEDAKSPLASFDNGAVENRNLPAMLALGLAVHPFKALTINANLNYYFNKHADDYDDYTAEGPAKAYVIGYDDDYEDAVELSFSVEYKILENLVASVGYSHAFSGTKSFDPEIKDSKGNPDSEQPVTLSDFEYTLDSNAFGLGARYGFLGNRLKITAAFCAVFYQEAQNQTVHPLAHMLEGKIKEGITPEYFNKKSFVFALGAEYRLF